MDCKDDELLLKQSPFQFNWSERYIACVGDNGGTTNDGILAGYKGAVQIIINDIKNGQGIEDELIYPLVYSIRHSIELALKISISIIRDIYYIKNEKFDIQENELHTHDIETLSKYVKKLYVIDKRISGLFDIALDYAKDFYFDKQSDIFRYECNLEGKELLKELQISHICIEILEKKFLRMNELFNDAFYSLEMMKNEYSLNTWTKKLSRNDIEQISKELMPITRWREEAFNDNKEEIKKKYGLSSKALSDAINIIKNNPLFANNINSSITLGKISDEELNQYAKMISEFTKPDQFETKERRAGEGMEELLKNIQKEAEKWDALSKNISKEALLSLAAFGNMFETGDVYCENYQKHYDHFEKDHNIRRDYLVRKIGTYKYALKVLKGMEWCGQCNYMTILLPLIEKIADENNFSCRYEKLDNAW
ncbi:hypothetical protein SAMN02745229_01204 [Butyrivibrio fibrisolvens DSM 3071]|uniref:Uncharacterized protein n=1 Tax=Butyrivibrio fibrisolvens DSM 3071 TaxID=1121131 RepID=A0A1M5X088_BUTFI|nr:hypothetical protein [Butyrivibrio fibrisolvens]SHH93032.1 hypothetical protein SAMN02745229_01204 [Butyrivibrio fibrisolvens DSM 3071]